MAVFGPFGVLGSGGLGTRQTPVDVTDVGEKDPVSRPPGVASQADPRRCSFPSSNLPDGGPRG
jgi:hypothetical protein